MLYYKALAKEKIKCTKALNELILLTGEQIKWLPDGYDVDLLNGNKTLQQT